MEGSSAQWEKLNNLGAGASGIVSLWRNTQSKEMLAVKICRYEKNNSDPKVKDSWLKEISFLKQLNHSNIIKVLDLPPTLNIKSVLPVLCMEFCSKGDLRKVLCKPENICGLPEENVKAILGDMKSAIMYLHSIKIYHRDIKPENVVLQEVPDPTSSSNSKIVYKLIDLGYAKQWDQSSFSSTFVGTLQYIAPELFNQQGCTRTADYWSFGLVCHEIITGFRPFLPNVPLFKWMEIVSHKQFEHISIYETADGIIEYQTEIFPENHITQPLKYALEDWLRLALEWDFVHRGKSIYDDSLLIFSTLEAALNKKIVTVFCVKKLNKLSYEIDESTFIRTLKEWIVRETGMTACKQLLLLPSGETLDDVNKPILPYLDSDPRLVAMLYVVPKDQGVILPSVETIGAKHPQIVKRMLESSGPFSYDVVRRMWAHSIYFIQSVQQNYRSLIEAYSAKMLLVIGLKKKLMDLSININSYLQKLPACIDLSLHSLKIDLENIKSNQFSSCIEPNKGEIWKSAYRTIEQDLSDLHSSAEKLLPEIDSRLEQINKLQISEEPGEENNKKLTKLLSDGRKLFGELLKCPLEVRQQTHDSSKMKPVIFSLWDVIGEISDDKPFKEHLGELFKTEQDVIILVKKLNDLSQQLQRLNDRVKKTHSLRQRDVWNIAKQVNQPAMLRSLSESVSESTQHAPALPNRIPFESEWYLNSKK